MRSPVVTSQTLTVRSADPDAKRVPSWEKRSTKTSAASPDIRRTSVSVTGSSRTMSCPVTAASREPSGLRSNQFVPTSADPNGLPVATS